MHPELRKGPLFYKKTAPPISLPAYGPVVNNIYTTIYTAKPLIEEICLIAVISNNIEVYAGF